MQNKFNQIIEEYDTTLLADGSDKFVSLNSCIKPIHFKMKCIGFAYTVKLEKGDSSLIFEAIDKANKGDILVIDTSGTINTAVWGDTKSLAAKLKGLNGVIIDGSYRDHSSCLEIGFPVFAKDLVVHGSGSQNLGELNVPIEINNIKINPGDIIFGDENGVISIQSDEFDEVIKEAEEKKQSDERRKKNIINKYIL